MYELGTGVVDWERAERISDRYAVVELFEGPRPHSTIVKLKRIKEGLHGTLMAVVRETRTSDHIGDLFHGVETSTPVAGERVALGTGALFYEDGRVGVRPDDARTTLWLDIQALYRVHNQTVTLYFETSP